MSFIDVFMKEIVAGYLVYKISTSSRFVLANVNLSWVPEDGYKYQEYLRKRNPFYYFLKA